MNKRRFGLIAAAMGMAGLMGGAQATQPLNAQHQEVRTTGEMKATREHRKSKEAINVNAYGGLDFPSFEYDHGIPPHIYGTYYVKSGGGNKAKRNNKLRFTHNAKLRRRAA
ncbi:MAG: hypothetical protein EOO20_13350 [Chryseobacterium sp.]|nr:MAG: hypothetical protein EOO20_13350 [Chryseobacterium sp.]